MQRVSGMCGIFAADPPFEGHPLLFELEVVMTKNKGLLSVVALLGGVCLSASAQAVPTDEYTQSSDCNAQNTQWTITTVCKKTIGDP